MRLDDVFTLTPLGHAELRGGATSIGAEALGLLVRFDGFLTLAEIGGGLPEAAMRALKQATQRLVTAALLQRVVPDPFTLQLNADLRRIGDGTRSIDAEAALASLRRTGFYVQIARPRVPTVPRGPAPLEVLVVEDDPVLARFTRTYLRLNGFTVRIATNRAEVLQELRLRPVPDLVLLDAMLPDVDGFDVLLRLRQHADFHDVPVVMLTSTATREGVIRGLRRGADGYVTKPCEPEALMQVVRHVLHLSQDTAFATESSGPWTSVHSR